MRHAASQATPTIDRARPNALNCFVRRTYSCFWRLCLERDFFRRFFCCFGFFFAVNLGESRHFDSYAKIPLTIDTFFCIFFNVWNKNGLYLPSKYFIGNLLCIGQHLIRALERNSACFAWYPKWVNSGCVLTCLARYSLHARSRGSIQPVNIVTLIPTVLQRY